MHCIHIVVEPSGWGQARAAAQPEQGFRPEQPLTDVPVGQPLQQAGLLVAGRRSDAGAQDAQVRLGDLQGDVGRRADV